jgi:hypothetical protein
VAFRRSSVARMAASRASSSEALEETNFFLRCIVSEQLERYGVLRHTFGPPLRRDQQGCCRF